MIVRKHERIEVPYGDVVLLLTQREIDVIVWVTEGNDLRKFGEAMVGGPLTRMTGYLKNKTGWTGKPTALLCRVAYAGGLVGLPVRSGAGNGAGK